VTLDPWVLATIVAMAVATYLTRAGGYLLFRAIRPPPVLRTALAYIPGALFVSYVVPALANGGIQQWAGSIATFAIMVTTRSLAAAILGGTAAAWATWSLTS
jgi:uncharacterized membrane protein